MLFINYLDDSLQAEQNNLIQFNSNDTLLDPLKFGQKSQFVETGTQIVGKVFIKNIDICK